MKIFILFFSLISYSNIYDFKLEKADGKIIDLSKLKDKYILVTNIATKCGFTPQLDFLSKLHTNDKVEVIAIPSNEFGSQTPESNKEVVEFCKVNYNSDFHLLPKSKVTGDQKIKIISYLLEKSDSSKIRWNFEKFLIIPNEKKIIKFSSFSTKKILKYIK